VKILRVAQPAKDLTIRYARSGARRTREYDSHVSLERRFGNQHPEVPEKKDHLRNSLLFVSFVLVADRKGFSSLIPQQLTQAARRNALDPANQCCRGESDTFGALQLHLLLRRELKLVLVTGSWGKSRTPNKKSTVERTSNDSMDWFYWSTQYRNRKGETLADCWEKYGTERQASLERDVETHLLYLDASRSLSYS